MIHSVTHHRYTYCHGDGVGDDAWLTGHGRLYVDDCRQVSKVNRNHAYIAVEYKIP